MPTPSSPACVLTQRAGGEPRTGAPHLAEAASVVASARVDRAQLVAFRRGDASGVRALYREYGGLVYAVAHRVLGHHDLAEEAAQQTFVQAWQAADRLDVDHDPAAWLATIAKRAAIDIYRREARRPARALDDVDADDPALTSLPPDLDVLDAVWHVRRAIDALPPGEATVVRLEHLDALKHREITERLGFESQSAFCRAIKNSFGLTATKARLLERPTARVA